MLEFPNRIDTIDGSCIGVLRIKAFIKVIIEKCNNAASNCNAHSKNVDQNKQLILQEIPESDKEVVFQHSEVGLELRRGSERKVASFKEHATEKLLSVPSTGNFNQIALLRIETDLYDSRTLTGMLRCCLCLKTRLGRCSYKLTQHSSFVIRHYSLTSSLIMKLVPSLFTFSTREEPSVQRMPAGLYLHIVFL